MKEHKCMYELVGTHTLKCQEKRCPSLITLTDRATRIIMIDKLSKRNQIVENGRAWQQLTQFVIDAK